MKIKLYRKIIMIQLGILATFILHYFVTDIRGYKAVGGEFLLIPLLIVMNHFIKAISKSVKELQIRG